MDDEFYDSLEDDESPDRKYNRTKVKVNKSGQQSKIQNPTKTKIPFYIGETNKDDLILNFKSNQKLICYGTKNQSNTCNSCANIRLKNCESKTKSTVWTKQKRPTTYWGLFCAKNGLPLQNSDEGFENDSLSNKSIYGGGSTARTMSTLSTINTNRDGPAWDTPSMYANYMPKDFRQQINYKTGFQEDVVSISSFNTMELNKSEIDVNNLRSVSEMFNLSNGKRAISSRTNLSHFTSLIVPNLGSLGPDLESSKIKMERFKKQQEYGKKASCRNRARIIQLSKTKKQLENTQMQNKIL